MLALSFNAIVITLNVIFIFFEQLNLIGERDEVPIHFCDKCGLPIQLYGRMVCSDVRRPLLFHLSGEKLCD